MIPHRFFSWLKAFFGIRILNRIKWYMWCMLMLIMSLFAIWYLERVRAAVDLAQLKVSAAVVPHCVMKTDKLAINFGTFHVPMFDGTPRIETSSFFNLHCTEGVTALISLDQGKYPAGMQRQMSNGRLGLLSYEIYSTKDQAVAMRDNIVTYQVDASSPYTVTIFAFIPEGQRVYSGTYEDNLVVTVELYPSMIIEKFNAFVTIVFLPREDVYLKYLTAKEKAPYTH